MKMLEESVTGLSVEKGWKFKSAKLLCLDETFILEFICTVSSLNSFLP